jgi:hypothetical protein
MYFFPVKLDTCYQCGAIAKNFNKIWKDAGLGNESGSKEGHMIFVIILPFQILTNGLGKKLMLIPCFHT